MCGQIPGSLSHRRVGALHRDLDADQAPLAATVLGGAIESFDWPPKKRLPANLARACWVRCGKES
jgi:hypothetical protein